ncbi:hypothetical protein HUG17_7142 [Dermatophagoides farinae]|uniref:Uncharacterized protein n=1 Tax=Dermatophagoides farinae TaxID=6954 RepID=A0A9D4SCU5_DERFA|nr:uncharacterized protein LOC124494490 [Dermatophagoides farinae]XP_046913626.1 uncharacterized protein LOC124494490 [Dermatophagoides farinae]KAH7636936.1 hypothetical protein HUG17_7142 [Dermatophagoides farinae]
MEICKIFIFFLLMIIGGFVNNEILNYPIIWRKSNHYISTQLIEADILIHLESPCDILDQITTTNDSNIIGLMADYDWYDCQRSYARITSPLIFYCPAPSQPRNHNIGKRNVLSFAYSVVKVASSMVFNFLQPQTSIQVTPVEQLKKVLENQQLATMLKTKFSETGRLLNAMLDPDNKDFTIQLERLFPNITLGPNAPKRYWHLEGCQFEKLFGANYSNLHLRINGLRIDKDYSLLQADPFYIGIAENQTKIEQVCLAEYIGPKFLAYQKRTGCAKKVLFDPIKDQQAKFVFHSKSCSQMITSMKDQWRKIWCRDKSKIKPEEIVQIKTDNDHAYYYCFMQNRTVNGESMPCENQIYQTKIGNNITINRRTIYVKKYQSEQLLDFDPNVTEKLNDRIFHEDKGKIFEDLEFLVEKEHKLLSQIVISHISHVRYYAIGAAIAIVILTLGYICYQRYKSLKFRNNRRQNIEGLLHLAKIPMNQF